MKDMHLAKAIYSFTKDKMNEPKIKDVSVQANMATKTSEILNN